MASHYNIFEKKDSAGPPYSDTGSTTTHNNSMDEACAIRRTLQRVVVCPFAKISPFEVVVRVRD